METIYGVASLCLNHINASKIVHIDQFIPQIESQILTQIAFISESRLHLCLYIYLIHIVDEFLLTWLIQIVNSDLILLRKDQHESLLIINVEMLDFVFIDYFSEQIVWTFARHHINSLIGIRNETSSVILVYYDLLQSVSEVLF